MSLGGLAGARADPRALSRTVLHRLADRVRLARAAVPAQPSGHLVWRLLRPPPSTACLSAACCPGLLMVSLVAVNGRPPGHEKQDGARPLLSSPKPGAALWEAKWELLLPVIMLVGLFGGFGTLTEAAALTAWSRCFVETVIYRGIVAAARLHPRLRGVRHRGRRHSPDPGRRAGLHQLPGGRRDSHAHRRLGAGPHLIPSSFSCCC